MHFEDQPELRRTVFHTPLIEPARRIRAWRESLRCLAIATPLDDKKVRASLVCHDLGPIQVAHYSASAAGYIRDDSTIKHSQLDDRVMLQLLVRGEAMGRMEDCTFRLCQGDIIAFDLSRRTELQVAEGEFFNVLIPRDILCDDHVELHGHMLLAGSLRCRVLTIHLMRLLDVLQDLRTAHKDTLLDLTLGTVRSCLQISPPSEKEAQPWNAMLRHRILAYIDEHLDDASLDATLVRQAFRISRAHLYRLFPTYGGIQRYIRHRRLDAAFRDICNDPSLRIAELADHHGFSGERQFRRAFLERFEMTPSDLRRRQRAITHAA